MNYDVYMSRCLPPELFQKDVDVETPLAVKKVNLKRFCFPFLFVQHLIFQKSAALFSKLLLLQYNTKILSF